MKSVHPKIIAFTYQKGGLGKTAVSVNLATVLAWKGFKVLFIDGDRHNSASRYFRVHDETKVGFYDVLVGNCTLEEATQKVEYEKSEESLRNYKGFSLSVIPSYDNLGTKEDELRSIPNWQMLLRNTLEATPTVNEYDFILIDCPPESDVFLPILYNAADFFVLPMFPETQTFENLGITFEQIHILSDDNTDKTILGCVILNYEKRIGADFIVNKLRSADYIHCFDAIIPHYVGYDDTFNMRMPVLVFYHEYDRGRRLYKAYIQFANEIIEMFYPKKED